MEGRIGLATEWGRRGGIFHLLKEDGADVFFFFSEYSLVQIGRIVRIEEGPYAGKLAIIVEVIDHKRVRIIREN